MSELQSIDVMHSTWGMPDMNKLKATFLNDKDACNFSLANKLINQDFIQLQSIDNVTFPGMLERLCLKNNQLAKELSFRGLESCDIDT